MFLKKKIQEHLTLRFRLLTLVNNKKDLNVNFNIY